MKHILIIILLMGLSAPALAEDNLTDREIKHGLLTSALMVVDMQYSLDIKNHKDVIEGNGYFFSSPKPSDREYYQKTALGLASLWLFMYLTPEKVSIPIADTISTIEVMIIEGHVSLGLHLQF